MSAALRLFVFRLRYLKSRERLQMGERLALAMECGVLTWQEAFTSYRREVGLVWCVLSDDALTPMLEAPEPKVWRVAR